MRLALLLAPLLLAAPTLAQAPPPERQPAPPAKDARQEIEKVLASRKVTLNFPGTPLVEVVSFLQDITGLNVVLDPAVDPEAKVNLRLKDAALKKAVDLICEGVGLEAAVWCDVLYLHAKDAAPPAAPALPAGAAEAERKVREQKLTLNFDATPLEDALDFFKDLTGLDCLITAEASKIADEAKVSLRLRDLPVGTALSLMLLPRGLTWRVQEGTLVIAPRPADAPAALTEAELKRRLDQRITLSVEGTLRDAAARLGKLANVPVEVAPGAPKDDPVSLSLRDISARDALELLCKMNGRTWAIEGGKVLIR